MQRRRERVFSRHCNVLVGSRWQRGQQTHARLPQAASAWDSPGRAAALPGPPPRGWCRRRESVCHARINHTRCCSGQLPTDSGSCSSGAKLQPMWGSHACLPMLLAQQGDLQSHCSIPNRTFVVVNGRPSPSHRTQVSDPVAGSSSISAAGAGVCAAPGAVPSCPRPLPTSLYTVGARQRSSRACVAGVGCVPSASTAVSSASRCAPQASQVRRRLRARARYSSFAGAMSSPWRGSSFHKMILVVGKVAWAGGRVAGKAAVAAGSTGSCRGDGRAS